MHSIAVFVGSLRRESFNKKLALAMGGLGRDMFRFSMVDLDDVPMFNQDFEDDVPEPVRRIRHAVADADGVLLVTPEYNRSIPPVLQNALDWCSRPYGKGVWAGKPAALAGASPGAVGTAAAQAHLRSVMVMLGMCVMGQPEVCVQWTPDYLTEKGEVRDGKNRAFLAQFLAMFAAWVERHGQKSS